MVVGTTYKKLGDQKEAGNAWGDWDPEKFTVEDSAFGFITMEDGATIILESSWALNSLDVDEAKTSLCGTKAGADMKGGLRIIFHTKLVNAGIIQSMSRVAKCIDNGPMEGFWGILKRERYYGKRFTDRSTLVKMIEDYIDYYNNKRLQRNLGILTPMEKHEIYLQAA